MFEVAGPGVGVVRGEKCIAESAVAWTLLASRGLTHFPKQIRQQDTAPNCSAPEKYYRNQSFTKTFLSPS